MAIIETFLSNISTFLRTKDAKQLQDWLRVEPPLPEVYYTLGRELRESYGNSDVLEQYLVKLLPESANYNADEGDVWPGFLAFMKEYLEFWRDVNFEDLLETHLQLSGLVKYVLFSSYMKLYLSKHPWPDTLSLLATHSPICRLRPS
jgi:hypothetical protein